MPFASCMRSFLKSSVVLDGDKERLASLGAVPPQDAERAAQLNRVASSVNSMAINITRMAWFQVSAVMLCI
jgi:hypothetical protein